MAQAGSAQREPSMEEILASIRRIIEDSDTDTRVEEDSPAPAQDNGEADTVSSAQLRSFRDGLKSPDDEQGSIEPEAASLDGEAQPVGTASLDGEATEPEAAGEDVGMADASQQRAGPAHEASQADAWSRARHQAPEAESGAVAEHRPANDYGNGTRAAEPVAEASQTDAWSSFRKQAPEDRIGTATENRPANDYDDGLRPALISDFTGRKVAAAFEELSGAFEANRRKSFDDMAEEMLRPMLQDWLDNNLPGLVERLVREEIERVARGGSR